LKANLWKRLTAENTRNWVDMLDKLVNDYNNKKHSTIKMSPIDVSSEENEAEVYRNINKPLLIENVIKFKVGDSVRISRLKGILEKRYSPIGRKKYLP